MEDGFAGGGGEDQVGGDQDTHSNDAGGFVLSAGEGSDEFGGYVAANVGFHLEGSESKLFFIVFVDN